MTRIPVPIVLIASILLGFLSLFAIGDAAAEPPSLDLSEAERAWIRENPTVDIAADAFFPPISFARSNGKSAGMAFDLLALMERRTGLEFRYRMGPWSRNIEQALAHEVDAVLNADATMERQKYLIFTDVYLRMPQAIVVRRGGEGIRDIDDLRGRTVALIRDTVHVDYFRRYFPEIGVRVVDDQMARFELLQSGKVDAVVGALPVLDEFMRANLLSSFVVGGLYNSSQLDNLRIGVRNTAPELASILDKAIASIAPSDRQAVNAKWLPEAGSARTVGGVDHVDLSAEEIAWLRDHPVIRVAGDPAWAPIEFRGADGAFYGMSVDFLKRLSDMLDVRFEFADAATWTDAVEGVRTRDIDMFSAAMVTPSREEFATFTDPYISLSQVVFTRFDAPFVQHMIDLADKRIAVVRNYAMAEVLARNHPWLDLVPVDSIDAGLHAVADGDVDAFVGGILNVGYRIRELGLSNIKVAGPTPYDLAISMAARSDWPILHGILEKAIAAIPERDRNQIEAAWIGARVEQPVDLGRIALIGAIVAIAVLSLWIWQLMVQRKRILESQEKLRIAEQKAVEANRAKNHLLATMSHELRTPLNAIQGFSDVIRNQLFGSVGNDKYVGYAEDIHSSGGLLLSLINDLLDVSSIEAGKREFHEEWIDVEDFLEGCMRTFDRSARDKGVGLVRDGVPSSTNVSADRRALTQIFTNLVSNGIKFTPAGGRVSVWLAAEDGTFRLVVSDTGIGMSADVLEMARRPFARGHKNPMHTMDGVGLGLSIVDGLVRAMGGRMTIESEPGEGTRVEVSLPVSVETQALEQSA